jgi:hypothetical protein
MRIFQRRRDDRSSNVCYDLLPDLGRSLGHFHRRNRVRQQSQVQPHRIRSKLAKSAYHWRSPIHLRYFWLASRPQAPGNYRICPRIRLGIHRWSTNNDCLIPLRLLDSKPSHQESSNRGRGSVGDPEHGALCQTPSDSRGRCDKTTCECVTIPESESRTDKYEQTLL